MKALVIIIFIASIINTVTSVGIIYYILNKDDTICEVNISYDDEQQQYNNIQE